MIAYIPVPYETAQPLIHPPAVPEVDRGEKPGAFGYHRRSIDELALPHEDVTAVDDDRSVTPLGCFPCDHGAAGVLVETGRIVDDDSFLAQPGRIAHLELLDGLKASLAFQLIGTKGG